MRASPSSHLTPTAVAYRRVAGMGETTNRACFVAGAVNPRPPGPPADPCRPSHQAGRAQHAWGGRVHVRPACTLSGTSYVRACTVGSRRKSACRVLRRIVGPRGQNPSVESVYRVPGQWHRQWTALDLIERALNMCYFRGAAKHGLGVNGPRVFRVKPLQNLTTDVDCNYCNVGSIWQSSRGQLLHHAGAGAAWW